MKNNDPTAHLHNKGTDKLLAAIAKAKPRRQTAMEQILSERINYGGIYATRYQAFKHAEGIALANGADERSAHRCGDVAAFKPPKVESADECALTWEQAVERRLV